MISTKFHQAVSFLFIARGCPHIVHDGQCLYFSGDQKSYQDAHAFCINNGADLLSIVDEAHKKSLLKLLEGGDYAEEYLIGK